MKECAPLLPAIYDINDSQRSHYLSTETGQKIEIVSDVDDDDKNSRKSASKLPAGQSTLSGVTFNLINALLGVGILAMPYSYAKCGIIGGMALMLLFAILCTYTLNLLIIAGQHKKVINYEDLGYECYGYGGYIAVSLCMFLLDYGVMITCLIIIGDGSSAIMQVWGISGLFARRMEILVVSIFIIFPLTLQRDISKIEFFSFLKVLALTLVTVVIIYDCFVRFEEVSSALHAQQGRIKWFDINGIPFALGIFAFAFVCHDTAFLYYNSLYNPTIWRWTRLSLGGIGSAMVISVLLSIPAYLTFTEQTQGNILNNYEISSVLIIIVRVLYILCMALTYPIPLFIVRHIVYEAYTRWKYRKLQRSMHDLEARISSGIKDTSLKNHLLFSCTAFFSSLAISMFIDNLGVAMSVIGSLSSVNLAFVFPCAFYLNTVQYDWRFWKYDTLKLQCDAFLSWYPPALLGIFGVFIGIYSVVITLMQQNNE